MSEFILCTHCGAVNEPDSDRCSECDKKVED